MTLQIHNLDTNCNYCSRYSHNKIPALYIFPETKPQVYYISWQSIALRFYRSFGCILLKNISFMQSPFGIPEIIAVLCYCSPSLESNTLLSIGSGTIVYIILIQVVF